AWFPRSAPARPSRRPSPRRSAASRRSPPPSAPADRGADVLSALRVGTALRAPVLRVVRDAAASRAAPAAFTEGVQVVLVVPGDARRSRRRRAPRHSLPGGVRDRDGGRLRSRPEPSRAVLDL